MLFPDPELLRVLLAFHESKNLVEAAERLRISQPAVSQRLQRLQGQVAMPLYAFEGRKKVLTHYGVALYDLAKENWKLLEQGYENLNRRYANASELVLKLGGRAELLRFFSELVSFSGRIEFQQMDERQCVQGLHNSVIDIALTPSLSNASEFESHKILESSSRIVFHKKFFDEVESFRDLQKQKKLLLATPSVAHRLEPSLMEAFCRGLKVDSSQLSNKALVDDWPSILALVEGGEGFAVLPGFIALQSRNTRFFDIPHAIIPRQNFYAVFPRKLKKVEVFREALKFNVWSS
jgi:DNA-binding transcriptional LysR family regulator